MSNSNENKGELVNALELNARATLAEQETERLRIQFGGYGVGKIKSDSKNSEDK